MTLFRKITGKSKPRRDDMIPLIESDNNCRQYGYGTLLNTGEEGRLQGEEETPLQELAEFLGVALDANASGDGSCCSMPPEPNATSQKQKQKQTQSLIQRSVSHHFPKPPADLNQNLEQHLLNVQATVHNELVRLDPLLKSLGLMGCLIDCYHRHTFDHLNELLKDISSTQNSFVLMKWVLHTYMSPDVGICGTLPTEELLGHPELQAMQPIKKVDLLLFTEWAEKAKDKVLQNVQKDVREYLDNILQNERSQEGCDREAAYITFYEDTLQCIEAMPKEAQKISSKLSDLVQEVCCQELLMLLKRYIAEKTKILGKKAKMDKAETMDFFKTLKACQELKQHVQTKDKGKDIKRSLLRETVAVLENMEAFTSELLMKIITDNAENHFKNYFKTEDKQLFHLIDTLKTQFPKLMWCQDVHKREVNKAYKLIAHIYLKHLVRSSQSQLKKRWSPDVGQTVFEDAELLHCTISDLAPGVQQWNLMLLKISELLECQSTDAVKLVVAGMQNECLTWSEDLEHLPKLLRWKGLSGRKVREVLDAIPGYQPSSQAWYSFLTCC